MNVMKKVVSVVKKSLTPLIKGGLLAGLFLASPVIMDEIKDIHLMEVMAPKASSVSIRGKVVASSSQIRYKGKRYTLTNQHVCRILDEVDRSKKYSNEELVGKELNIGGRMLKVLSISKEHDLCILEPDMEKGSFSLALFSKPGERVTLIGHPRGLPQTIREGRIISSQESNIPWIEKGLIPTQLISATSYPGNSGSPVLNRFGNLIGVLFAGQGGIHTEALIVPLDEVKAFLNRYEESLTK